MAEANLLAGYASDPSSEEQDNNSDQTPPVPPPPVNLTGVPSPPPNPPHPSQHKHANPTTPNPEPSNQSAPPPPLTRPSPPPLPPDVARELSRSGHLPSDVTFINIDARASTHQAPRSHKPAPTLAIQSRANRIAKSSTHISRLERRKHQITALAADAQALETARRALGGGTMGMREVRGRRGGRR